jgi:cobalt-zinc-cadmium resistance protein CzcA
MLEKLIHFSIRQRWLVLIVTLGMCALGVYNYPPAHRRGAGHHQRPGADQHRGPGFSPLEAEQRVTYPVETAMAGLPKLDYTARSRATGSRR